MGSLSLFALVLTACTTLAYNTPVPTVPTPPSVITPKVPMEKGLLKFAKDKLLAACQKKKNKCKGQTEEYQKSRNKVKNSLIQQLQRLNGTSDQDAAEEVEKQLKKVYAIKLKIHEKYGLQDIDPSDDGLFEEDIILSPDMADAILDRLENPREIPETPGTYKSKRLASLYFEDYPGRKWRRMPIHYWISDEFTDLEKTLIDSAIRNISIVAPCITFTKDTDRLTTGQQMQYVRDDSNCGGSIQIGFRGISTINIGYKTGKACTNVVFKGKVMHETIHALGGGHEHSRIDRDKYIEIMWDNIDPQRAHNFEVMDTSTSYGVPYDYSSRMHYSQIAFAIDKTSNTIRPIVDEGKEMGSDYLTPGDILQLNRMYCRPATCLDNSQWCGNWAAVGEYCDTEVYGAWMAENCPRSCGVC